MASMEAKEATRTRCWRESMGELVSTTLIDRPLLFATELPLRLYRPSFLFDTMSRCLHCDYMDKLAAVSRERGVNHGAAARRAGGAAFTLIELMATIAIVVIVAGLTLGTLGYVNRKGADSRARAEVATISAAIDSYKIDFGSYPADATVLYQELTGQGTVNTSKVYIEPTPSLVTDTINGPFVDPWGTPYNYRNPGTDNVGFFDLWTTAGGQKDQALWIRN